MPSSKNSKTPPTIASSKCKLLEQGIVPDSFDDTQLPTDVHIVKYIVGGETYFDAVRSYSMTDIFDCYFDHLKEIGKVVSIKSGFGRIKPRVYGAIKSSE